MVFIVFIMFRAEDEIIYKDIGRECDDSDSKAGEDVPEHHASLKDGVLAPGISLRPRVSKKRKVGHAILQDRIVVRSIDKEQS